MKKYIEQFNEFKKNPYFKPIMFFGGYALLFIILFSVIGLFGDRKALFKDYESGNKSSLRNNALLKNNFSYDYKITLDGVLYDYYGKGLGEVESFKYNNQDYFKKGDNFFVNNNGTWTKTDNPFKFREFYEPESLNGLLTDAYYQSKTEFDSGEEVYNFLLSSNTIYKDLYNKNTDYDDVPSNVVVKLDNEGAIKSITYKLDNYCKVSDSCNSLNIELNYDLFGEIKEIKNPIE